MIRPRAGPLGEVTEWPIVLVSKTSVPARVPRVRIPASPPRKHGPERSQQVPGRLAALAPVLGANLAKPGQGRTDEAKAGRVLSSSYLAGRRQSGRRVLAASPAPGTIAA